MWVVVWYHKAMQEFFIQMLVAAGLGLSLGVERMLSGKSAGMRTYAMVSLGSALFVAIGIKFGLGDMSRIPAAVITGVGFLGAGLIIFKDDRVTNMTSAADLWVASGVGIAVGLGFQIEATFVTLLALFIMTVLSWVEHHIYVARAKFEKKKKR